MKYLVNLIKLSIIITLIFATALAKEFSQEEKLAQMFIVGIDKTEYDSFKKAAEGVNWGGYIFYSKVTETSWMYNIISPPQITRLLKSLKGDPHNTDIKPFLVVDLEGGYFLESSGLPTAKSPQKVGILNDPSSTKYWSRYIADRLVKLGFNTNLAPVVDVDLKKQQNWRSFHYDPEKVVKHSAIFIDEHRSKRLVTAIKHFPGKGSSSLEIINDNYNEEIDLIPFRQLIESEKADMVMVSNITYTTLYAENKPAFLSRIIINKLRKDLNYKGVIITDNLSYLNTSRLSAEELEDFIVRTIETGNDIMLFANNTNYDKDLIPKLKSAVENIVRKRRIDVKRIEKSFEKIIKLKWKYKINPKEIYLNFDI